MHQEDSAQLNRQIQAQSLEKQLQDLADSSQPSYHENFKPPRALAILKLICADGYITVKDFDYQITKIELTPIATKVNHAKCGEQSEPQVGVEVEQANDGEHGDEAHHQHGEQGHGGGEHPHGGRGQDPASAPHLAGHSHDDLVYESSMQKILKRQINRGYHSPSFGETLASGDDHGAFHIYVAESTENGYSPLHMIPKHIDGDVVKVLTVEGVDYVLADILLQEESTRTLQETIHINTPPKASVDLWPEEIVLHPATQGGQTRTYLRADVIYYDAGIQFDQRLQN